MIYVSNIYIYTSILQYVYIYIYIYMCVLAYTELLLVMLLIIEKLTVRSLVSCHSKTHMFPSKQSLDKATSTPLQLHFNSHF